MESEAGALVREQVPVEIESQRWGESNDDFFPAYSCCLHLLVKMCGREQHVFAEEVVFKCELADGLVERLYQEGWLGHFSFLTSTEAAKVHHREGHA